MVAINSSRRHVSGSSTKQSLTVESLAGPRSASLPSELAGAASRRRGPSLEVERQRGGEIVRVRIGRWRILSSGPQRRLAEVRELAAQRVAVRIERFADSGPKPTSEIWQLYDLEGRLEAALQSTPDGKFSILSNYLTRQACRLCRDASGEFETVESWSI